jgi:hypothetical protein
LRLPALWFNSVGNPHCHRQKKSAIGGLENQTTHHGFLCGAPKTTVTAARMNNL